jgi:23S rRNA (uridine2552-2'-O)-methyltransferase
MSKKSWMDRHVNDEYVKRSQKDGYPSRAAYKLLALQESYKVLRPGMAVVDLGAAPGGWSVVAAKCVGKKGRVYAVDLLEMDPVDRVKLITADCFDENLSQQLSDYEPKGMDLVMSDMAPNMTGHRSVDQPRSMAVVEMAATLASELLKPGGTFLAKVFQGEGIDEFRFALKKQYKKVMMRKPPASRSSSREFYVLATEFVGYNEIKHS